MAISKQIEVADNFVTWLIHANAAIKFLNDNKMLTTDPMKLSAKVSGMFIKKFQKNYGLKGEDVKELWLKEYNGMNIFSEDANEREIFGSVAHAIYVIICEHNTLTDYVKRSLEKYKEEFDVNNIPKEDDVKKVLKVTYDLVVLTTEYFLKNAGMD